MKHAGDLQRLIHEIGRGPRGSRDLALDEARVLWNAILDGRLPPAATGAALMAMRLKGESLDEMRALREALRDRLAEVAVGTPFACMPCYNGARRVPNLTWLTALALRQAGIAVLLHGVRRDAQRLATCEVAQAAGPFVVETVEAASRALREHGIAFLPIDVWCEPLADMLALRAQMGVRNSGHSVAKWLRPHPAALLFAPVTHLDYLESALALLREDSGPAIVFRGVDGEPTLYPHAPRTVHTIAASAVPGVPWAGAPETLRVHAHELRLPASTGERDAAITLAPGANAHEVAVWSAAVIRGDRPMPSMIEALVDLASLTLTEASTGMSRGPRRDAPARSAAGSSFARASGLRVEAPADIASAPGQETATDDS